MADGILRKIGPYEVVGLLGQGGMANVYRAIQPSMERREVAIKVLPATFSQDPAFLERFQREIRLVARLQHPRILPVYDSGEDNGTPYIVMALMGGGTLSEHIHATPQGMPLAEAARLVEQMAEGLDYAHRQGVIHRDFKPSNVLLDTEGNVHLSDFGIARATAETAQLTGAGLIGTPAYMAPEMSSTSGLSPLIDIYALGITVYQMLTGQQPYDAATPMGLLMAHLSQPIPDVRKYRPDLTADAQIVILRGMAKDPALRYQTARALADDLKAVAVGKTLDDAGLRESLTMPIEGDSGAHPPVILAAPVPHTSPTLTPPPASTQARPVAHPASLPVVWLIGGAVAALICVIAAVAALLGGAFSLGSILGPLTSAAPSATAAPTVAPVVVVVTSTPSPTVPGGTPTPSTAPTASNVRFCDRPCSQGAANVVTNYPTGALYIYVGLEFSNMQSGTAYSREWASRGDPWVHYDCQWQGQADMQRDVTVRDNTGGLRSGEWTMTIAIEGNVVATASITLGGSNQHWNPFSPVTQPCPDWKK